MHFDNSRSHQSSGCALQVDVVPQYNGGGHQVRSTGAIALLLKTPIPDFTKAIKKHCSGKGIARLALVEACMNASRDETRRASRYPKLQAILQPAKVRICTVA